MNQITDKGLTPENIRYLEEYFVFDFSKAAICHFKIKEIPGWLFGIWLNDERHKYDIFGEPEEFIDKFKPGATYYSYKNISEFIEKMIDVRDNYDYYMAKDWYDRKEDIGRNDAAKISEVIKRHELKLIQEAKEELEDWRYTFDFFKKRIFDEIPQLEAVGVFDWHSKGWITYPRFSLTLQVKEEFYDDFDFKKPVDLHELKEKIDNNRPVELNKFSKYDFDFLNIIKYPINLDKDKLTYIYHRTN